MNQSAFPLCRHARLSEWATRSIVVTVRSTTCSRPGKQRSGYTASGAAAVSLCAVLITVPTALRDSGHRPLASLLVANIRADAPGDPRPSHRKRPALAAASSESESPAFYAALDGGVLAGLRLLTDCLHLLAGDLDLRLERASE